MKIETEINHKFKNIFSTTENKLNFIKIFSEAKNKYSTNKKDSQSKVVQQKYTSQELKFIKDLNNLFINKKNTEISLKIDAKNKTIIINSQEKHTINSEDTPTLYGIISEIIHIATQIPQKQLHVKGTELWQFVSKILNIQQKKLSPSVHLNINQDIITANLKYCKNSKEKSISSIDKTVKEDSLLAKIASILAKYPEETIYLKNNSFNSTNDELKLIINSHKPTLKLFQKITKSIINKTNINKIDRKGIEKLLSYVNKARLLSKKDSYKNLLIKQLKPNKFSINLSKNKSINLAKNIFQFSLPKLEKDKISNNLKNIPQNSLQQNLYKKYFKDIENGYIKISSNTENYRRNKFSKENFNTEVHVGLKGNINQELYSKVNTILKPNFDSHVRSSIIKNLEKFLNINSLFKKITSNIAKSIDSAKSLKLSITPKYLGEINIFFTNTKNENINITFMSSKNINNLLKKHQKMLRKNLEEKGIRPSKLSFITENYDAKEVYIDNNGKGSHFNQKRHKNKGSNHTWSEEEINFMEFLTETSQERFMLSQN